VCVCMSVSACVSASACVCVSASACVCVRECVRVCAVMLNTETVHKVTRISGCM